MRSQFVDILLREDEEPDYEGMFKAAAVSIEWLDSNRREVITHMVSFSAFGDDTSKRILTIHTFPEDGGAFEKVNSFCLLNMDIQKDYPPVWADIFDAAIPLTTIKRTVENWIKNDWYPFIESGTSDKSSANSLKILLKNECDHNL